MKNEKNQEIQELKKEVEMLREKVFGVKLSLEKELEKNKVFKGFGVKIGTKCVVIGQGFEKDRFHKIGKMSDEVGILNAIEGLEDVKSEILQAGEIYTFKGKKPTI